MLIRQTIHNDRGTAVYERRIVDSATAEKVIADSYCALIDSGLYEDDEVPSVSEFQLLSKSGTRVHVVIIP